MEGFLCKEGGFRRSFNRRWFILDGQHLTYYDSFDRKKDAPLNRRGVISVQNAVVESLSKGDARPFCFTVQSTDGRTLTLDAESEEYRANWIKALVKAATLHEEDAKRERELREAYEALELDPEDETLTIRAISKAFKRASLRHHPDKGGSIDVFNQLKAAHTTLLLVKREEEEIRRCHLVEYEAIIEKGGGGVGLGILVFEDKNRRQILVKSVQQNIILRGLSQEAAGAIHPGDAVVAIGDDDITHWPLSRVKARLNIFRVPLRSQIRFTFQRRVPKEESELHAPEPNSLMSPMTPPVQPASPVPVPVASDSPLPPGMRDTASPEAAASGAAAGGGVARGSGTGSGGPKASLSARAAATAAAHSAAAPAGRIQQPHQQEQMPPQQQSSPQESFPMGNEESDPNASFGSPGASAEAENLGAAGIGEMPSSLRVAKQPSFRAPYESTLTFNDDSPSTAATGSGGGGRAGYDGAYAAGEEKVHASEQFSDSEEEEKERVRIDQLSRAESERRRQGGGDIAGMVPESEYRKVRLNMKTYRQKLRELSVRTKELEEENRFLNETFRKAQSGAVAGNAMDALMDWASSGRNVLTEVNDLKEELLRKNREMATMSDNLASHKESNRQYKETVRELTQVLQAKEAELQEVKGKHKELKRVLKSQTESIQQLEARLSDRQRQLVETTQSLDDALHERDGVQIDLDNARRRLADLEADKRYIAGLPSDQEELMQQIYDLREQARNLERERDTAIEQSEQSQRTLRVAHTYQSSMRESFSKAEERAKRAETQLKQLARNQSQSRSLLS